ncbi:DnaJ-domain-containing protein, partial [Sistotremastrum suecicum HHB10207 ss-3]
FYELLSISRTASIEEIKQAYRRTLLRHHPDRQRGSSAFDASLLKRAYQTLVSPASRALYDASLGKTELRGPESRPAQVVSLEEFEERGTGWTYRCRCGGQYELSEREIESETHVVGCDGCSETIWAGYEVVEEQ